LVLLAVANSTTGYYQGMVKMRNKTGCKILATSIALMIVANEKSQSLRK